jgi:hypothetical protein
MKLRLDGKGITRMRRPDDRRTATQEGKVKYFIALMVLFGSTFAVGNAAMAWSYEQCVAKCAAKEPFNQKNCVARNQCSQYPHFEGRTSSKK